MKSLNTLNSEKSNLSLMNKKKRYEYLRKNWVYIRNAVMDILSDSSFKKKDEIKIMLPERFSESLVLGEGMWGIVLKLKNEKIIAKVSSDLLELSLIDVILKTRDSDSDFDLSADPGIPYIAGLRLFNDLNGIVVREDLDMTHITLSASSVITRSVECLIKHYVTPLSTDEMVLSDIIHENQDTSLRDVAFAHSILKGNALKYSRKTIANMPAINKNSKSFHVVCFIKKILQRYSIALIDLHSQNLARLKHDLSDIFGIKRNESDFKKYVISDLGLAYDTPIMAIDSPIFSNFTNLPALKRKKPMGVVLDRMVSLYLSRDDTFINTVYDNLLTRDYMVRRQTSEIRRNPYLPNEDSKTYLIGKLSAMSEQCFIDGVDFLNSSDFYKSVYLLAQNIINMFGFDVDIHRFSNSIFQEFIMHLFSRVNDYVKEQSNGHSMIGFGLCDIQDISDAFNSEKRAIKTYINSDLIFKLKSGDFNMFKDIPEGYALAIFSINKQQSSFDRLRELQEHAFILDKIDETVLYIPQDSFISLNGL